MITYDANNQFLTENLGRLINRDLKRTYYEIEKVQMHPAQCLAVTNLHQTVTISTQKDFADILAGKHFPSTFMGHDISLDTEMSPKEIWFRDVHGRTVGVIKNLAVPGA